MRARARAGAARWWWYSAVPGSGVESVGIAPLPGSCDDEDDATARVVRTSGRVTGATTIALLRMPPVAADAPAPPVADGDSGGEEE